MKDTDAFSALDNMLEPEAPPPAKEVGQVPPSKGSGSAETAEKPSQTPDGTDPKAVQTAKEIGKTEPLEPKPQKAATLRENYDRLKGELKQAQERLSKYDEDKAKIPQQDNHLKELQAKYEELQKKHEERENEMRFVNYERSQEYKDKWETPFVDAYTAGRNKLSSIKVIERKNDVEEVVQAARMGTASDFDSLMAVSDDDQAAQMAQDLFGSKAPMVLYHRERVQELNSARLKAIDDYKKQGSEREKTIQEQTKKQQQEASEVYQQTVKAARENPKYKDYFAPAEGDTYGNNLLEQGDALADLAHGVLNKQDFGKLPKAVQDKIEAGKFDNREMVKLHAAIRNKAAGFDRLAYKYRAAMKQIEELQKSLSDYEESAPPSGKGGGRAAVPADEGMKSVLAGMDRYVT